MTPLGQSPLALGADIVIHSATKFLGGHSDLIAGAAITNREVANALYLLQNGTGTALSAYDGHLQNILKHYQFVLNNLFIMLNVLFNFESKRRFLRCITQEIILHTSSKLQLEVQ